MLVGVLLEAVRVIVLDTVDEQHQLRVNQLRIERHSQQLPRRTRIWTSDFAAGYGPSTDCTGFRFPCDLRTNRQPATLQLFCWLRQVVARDHCEKHSLPAFQKECYESSNSRLGSEFFF